MGHVGWRSDMGEHFEMSSFVIHTTISLSFTGRSYISGRLYTVLQSIQRMTGLSKTILTTLEVHIDSSERSRLTTVTFLIYGDYKMIRKALATDLYDIMEIQKCVIFTVDKNYPIGKHVSQPFFKTLKKT